MPAGKVSDEGPLPGCFLPVSSSGEWGRGEETETERGTRDELSGVSYKCAKPMGSGPQPYDLL